MRQFQQSHNLDEFGLTWASLRRLGSTPVDAYLHLRSYEVTPAVRRLPPARRHDYLAVRVDRWIASLCRRFPGTGFKAKHGLPAGTPGRSWSQLPSSLFVHAAARDIERMAGAPGVWSVYLERVPGRRRQRRPLRTDVWFCVRALVAIRVEDVTNGIQTVEDRFVMVRASSEADAEERLRKTWREYAEPYLNSEGHMVSWSLEKVVDVYDTMETDLDPAGCEVYSKLHGRRIRPEMAWRPRHPPGRARARRAGRGA
jgi:hypothetical protein